MASNEILVEDEGTEETTFSDAKTFNNDDSFGGAENPKGKRSNTFLKVAGGIAILGAVVLVVVLPVYFEVIGGLPLGRFGTLRLRRRSLFTKTSPDGNAPEDDVIVSPTTSPGIPESDRFNCYPEGGATQELCTARGCIWAGESSSNSPSCYYDGNDGYQQDGEVTTTATGYSVILKRTKPVAEPYGSEFENLQVTVTRMETDTLRIKITPVDNEPRYEVPWTHNPPSNVREEDALYEVAFVKTPGGLFGVKVTRKSTGMTLLDTSVGRMTFADQFLQISTVLPSQFVYGFGEHMHETFLHDMNWKTYGMFSRDQGVGTNANLYGVHPYYTCMEGDGNAHGVFFLNSNAQDVTLQPMPALTYRTIGGLFDIYMFVGPEPEKVVSQYTAVVGRPYMPPFWSLGFQLCRYGYGSLDKLKTVVDRNLASEIPYDIQYSDIDYMDRQLDFTINATTYTGLEDFVRDLKQTHKMKYIIIFDPAISGNETDPYPPFDLGVEHGVFITDPDGEIAWGKVWPDIPGVYVNTTWDWESQTEAFRAYTAFPDFFKGVTQEWWKNLTVDFHQRIEFDGLWIDMNEPASFVHGSPSGTCRSSKWDNPLPYHPHILGGELKEKTTCMSNLQHHPMTMENVPHYNVHSLYGWSQSAPTLEACRESTGERCMIISRSTFPGSGKYVGHWLGDNTSLWSHLQASIIGMLEFNLFGIPYIGADICGFFQDTTEELCMRWMQLGAFYPFSRNHNGIGWADQDPAVFGPEFVAAVKKTLEVRYYILPYFYTLFFDAHTTGSTVIRSLMAEFPNDLETYSIDKQMLLGGEILLTPAMEEGIDSVEGYVPDDRWFDFYTGAELARGLRKTSTHFYAPWDHIPIHIRGGSIIPTQNPARTTEIQRANPLGVVYAMSDDSLSPSTGHLFWDDGTSIDTIENDLYILVNFEGTRDLLSSTVERNGYAEASSMTFDHLTVMGVESEQVIRVVVNGIPHDQFTFDSTTKTLRITDLSLSLTSDWVVVWDSNQFAERFDCHPETFISATQARCQGRGCAWGDVAIPGVPWCYYPSGYKTYKKDTTPVVTDYGEELFLERLETPALFKDPVQRLKVEIEAQSEHQLRIKISDPAETRYEVPLVVNGATANRTHESDMYEVIYQDEPFAFQVIRRSTREVIMDTSVGALIFEDQFLQISSRTSTSYMYGFGEAEHPNYLLDFHWTTQAMFARGEGVKQNANLYGHHPYHMAMEKNGDAHGILFLNSNAMEVDLTPLPAITYRTIGGILDFYIFMGPTPEQVVQQYTMAIGTPMMPPYWALGFQLCKYDYGGIENLKTVVEEMRSYDIPYDVQYGDIDYMDRQLDFTVDDVNYQGLSDYVNTMRDDYKMRYVIILDPAISADETDPYPPYDDGVTQDIFIKTSDGQILFGNVWPDVPGTPEPSPETRARVAFPDFLKPQTSVWWKKQVVDFYNNQLKFDGLWIDMNEPENFISGQLNHGGCPANNNPYDHPPYLPSIRGDSLFNETICMSATSYNPHSGKEDWVHYNVHSIYGWSEAQPTMEACREATGRRCYVISRSTYPGAGKYTGHWLGDNTSKWPHLKSSIIQMFEFGLFGFAYTGADICGFFEDAEEEMCMRWSQLGAFYPFSRNHAMRGVRRQDPAAWGPDFANAVRNVLRTRYTLLPYLYTLFYESQMKGSTVVRPLMHEFTSDKATWDIDTQFLWGPAIMISPVLEAGKTAVEAYIPDARWYDINRYEEVGVRGVKAVLAAPKEHINVHQRGGYIIPYQYPANTTFYSRQEDFYLVVTLDDDQKASGELFWDDGDTANTIRDKTYIYTTFTCEGNVLENRIVNDGFSESSTMKIAKIIVAGLKDDVTQVLSWMIPLMDYQQDINTKVLDITVDLTMNEEFLIRWEVNNEWSRIDCMPDLDKDANRADCESRGCLWSLSTTPGVPFCFFPTPTTHGYDLTNNNEGGSTGVDSYTLERTDTPTLYGGDISTIQLDLEYQTNKRLHFKFFDPNADRWEIPKEANVLSDPGMINSSEMDADYIAEVSTSNPVSLKVTRKDNNEVMFDSSVGVLQFADQFLQISTSLPSLNVYGFGEHNHRRYRHDLNWRRWALFTRDVAPVDDWNLYGMQTFFMAMMNSNDGKCFGLYLHNTNAMDVVLQPTPALTYRLTGGVLDFYLFVANSPEELIQEYHQIIGYPVMPPYWGLGFQLSRWNYGSLDRVKEVVDEVRAAKIPFDIQYGDIDYMDAKKSFTYDKVNFDGLPDFVDELHDWGMRYVIILDPGIKIESGYNAYDEGIKSDIFIKNPEGEPLVTEVWPGETHHPDYTNPDSTAWWTKQCQDFHNTQGVKYDALWIDMNEPANFQPDDPQKLALMNCIGKYNFPPYMPRILGYWVGLHDKTFCMDNIQHYGLHYYAHSLYGHTMSLVTHSSLQEVFPDKRSFVFTRSTFAGTGKYAQHWLGDNQSLWPQMAWAIPAMFEFNLFGFPYVGADICGFYFNTTAEMCQRWMQVGAFYPFARNHNAADMIPQHPTVFGDNVTASSKKALEIRYSILPYMYTYFYMINDQGGTLVRALVHEFPSDQHTWNQDRQFLLGPAFLVTPVMEEGVTEVTAYFPPASRWFDFYTGVEIEDVGKFISLDAPIDYINLHVRGGYILPMQAPNVTTTLSRQQSLSLLVALDATFQAEGMLYWDDGEARDVGEAYQMLTFSCASDALTIEVKHSAVSLPEVNQLFFETVTVYGTSNEPTKVIVNGDNHEQFTTVPGVLMISDLHVDIVTLNTRISWS